MGWGGPSPGKAGRPPPEPRTDGANGPPQNGLRGEGMLCGLSTPGPVQDGPGGPAGRGGRRRGSPVLTVAAVLQVGPDDVLLGEAEDPQPPPPHGGVDDDPGVGHQPRTLIQPYPAGGERPSPARSAGNRHPTGASPPGAGVGAPGWGRSIPPRGGIGALDGERGIPQGPPWRAPGRCCPPLLPGPPPPPPWPGWSPPRRPRPGPAAFVGCFACERRRRPAGSPWRRDNGRGGPAGRTGPARGAPPPRRPPRRHP